MERGRRMIEIAGEIRGETARAWKFFDGEREMLLPKSLLKDLGGGAFEIPEWLAMDRGII